ncbi:MAG TPA: diguanylate cyclase [Candidatus Methylomirabilis sp.]|nr:diguanylate cyclase [Candidatus Methylomirabilis sp.]
MGSAQQAPSAPRSLGPRILVVDDEPIARQIITDALTDRGFVAEAVPDGPAALERVAADPPALVLLDILMPGLSGLEVLRKLKDDPKTQPIPVILVTAKDKPADLVEGLEAGADDYLTKPVDPSELLARVRAHLRTRDLLGQFDKDREDLAAVLEISRAVSSTLKSSEIFGILVDRTARIVQAYRCSLVLIGEAHDTAYVVASHDDPSIRNLKISLRKYPEIRMAVAQRQRVVVENIQEDPLLAEVRDHLKGAPFVSILVLPIIQRENVVGTLLLRTSRLTPGFTEREVRLCQLIADIAAGALQNAHLFESLELANVNLERLALVDDLTGAFNRRFFFRRLEEEFHRARRYKFPLACIFLDIDRFKPVNDRYGHLVGDQVLTEVAEVIRSSIRRTDILARYGGEEFAILLPMTSRDGAGVEGERIREAVRAHAFGGDAGPVHITVSLGVAAFPAPRVGSVEDLIARADDALYQAKSEGRDRLVASAE